MVATNEGRRSSRSGTKKSQREPKQASQPDAGEVSNGMSIASSSVGRAGDAPRIVPPRVAAREAERRISSLAAAVDTLDSREQLRRLACLVRKDGRNARRMAFLEAAIGECLDEVSGSPAGRWTVCEAATWALAWMARTKRAGGSAGGLLERLVGQARSAQALLASGDTQPARFVLVLAHLFADVEACRCLEAGAAATVAAEIERLVSADGIPHLNGSGAIGAAESPAAGMVNPTMIARHAHRVRHAPKVMAARASVHHRAARQRLHQNRGCPAARSTTASTCLGS
jgi:hypothetical protein